MAEPCILFTGDADSVHLRRWVLEMARRGFECHVLTRRPGAIEGAASVTAIRPGGNSAGWFAALPAVRRHARRLAPDLVHGHYVTSNGLWAAACGVRPVVLTAWGSDVLVTPRQGRLQHALTGWILRRADLLTGDSLDLLAAMAAFRPRAACHEILWGADTERFCPPHQPREAGVLHLVSLRAWEPNYNIDVIVAAMALLRAEQPAVQLWLLGGGSLEVALREQVRALDLVGQVHFVGRQDDAGMVECMQRAHVSVSVPSSDATSVALLESLACGLAVVASDLPANRQWVDAAAGALVPVRDAAALARALARLARDFDALAAMGRHNRSVALAKLSRAVQMDHMAALYHGLIQRARPGLEPMTAGNATATKPTTTLARDTGIGTGAAMGTTTPTATAIHTATVTTTPASATAAATPTTLHTVSLIVPCRNERAHVEAFCASALAQQLPPGWTLELVIADGASDDGTRFALDRVAAADARVRLVDNPSRIVSCGLNLALANAAGEVIVRMDVHTTYASDYVAECLAALARSGADNVGGPWRAVGEGGWQRAIAAAFQSRWVAGGALSRRLDHEGLVDTVYLGAWPRATFERFGTFDEALVRNQDDEHNLRIVKAGGRVWQSARIRSEYRPRDSLAALWRQWLQYGYWKPFVMKKHGRSAAVRQLVPGLYVTLMGALLLGAVLGAPAWPVLLGLGLYAALVLVLSVAVARQASWALLPRLPWVIAAQQLGYGVGSVVGAWDAMIGGRARERFTRLSR